MVISIRSNKKQAKAVLITGVVLLVVLTACLIIHLIPYPALEVFQGRAYSTVYTASGGEILQVRAVDGGVRRQYTPLEKMPPQLVRAVLKAEDSRFYRHYGVDPLAVIRAGAQNLLNRRSVSGASTITMQLVRIMEIRNSRTLGAKLAECGKAVLLESHLTKKQILELYLNNIPFGNNIEGVTSAAWYFFGKQPDQLTEEECLCLAVIPRRPVSYNPIEYPDHTASAAWHLVPAKSAVTWESLLETAKGAAVHSWPFKAPHAVERAQAGSDFSADGRLPVVLTLDEDVQKLAEFELGSRVGENGAHRIENGSCIVIDNETGRIIAYVGSNDWFDEEHSGQIDGVTVPQQMGSSMKPFLYAAAIEEGILQPSDVLADIPREFGSATLYFPQNFNNRYNGPVMLRKALASSLNVPAVTTLDTLGVDCYLQYLSLLGFSSLEGEAGKRAGLGLSLGAGEVTLEELTRAFSVFANDGSLISLTLTGEQDHDFAEQVYDVDTARIIADFLSDKSARAGGFGQVQTFETSYPSIFKTGTANQYQNIVAVGATPRYTAGVWMGNFSGNTVMGKTGSSLPALVARTILDFLTQRDAEKSVPPAEFQQPEGYTKIRVCSVSGKKPSSYCLHTVTEYCLNELVDSAETCTWHKPGAGKNVELVLSALYEPWLLSSSNRARVDYSSSPLSIATPADGSVFWKGSGGAGEQIPVAVIGGTGDEDAVLQVTYDTRSFTVSRPFTFTLPVERGSHILTVNLDDQYQTIRFTVK